MAPQKESGTNFMKLATLSNGSRYGELVVVSRDLKRYVSASDAAKTMRDAIDDWATAEPKLQAISDKLNAVENLGDAFDVKKAMAPLPNPSQWADGSAYVNHVELVRKARNAEVPESFYHDPLMYQGGSDSFLAPREDIPLGDTAWGCDMEGEVAVITDDVPMGVSAEDAAGHIKLVMLVNDVSLRGLIPGELAKGFGFFQ